MVCSWQEPVVYSLLQVRVRQNQYPREGRFAPFHPFLLKSLRPIRKTVRFRMLISVESPWRGLGRGENVRVCYYTSGHLNDHLFIQSCLSQALHYVRNELKELRAERGYSHMGNARNLGLLHGQGEPVLKHDWVSVNGRELPSTGHVWVLLDLALVFPFSFFKWGKIIVEWNWLSIGGSKMLEKHLRTVFLEIARAWNWR